VATYTVTFVYDDGGVTPNKQETVNEGDTVNRPTDPTRTDYLFAGWYNGTTLYTFRDGVTSDLTLTAHWNKDGYALTWTENEAISYVYDGTLPTFVDKGADVSFGVKQVNPFYDVDEGGIVVKAGGTVLEAENGVYTFKADAAKTITVEGLTKNTRPMTGTGTKADPYVITTAYQLKTFSDRVNSDDNNDNAYASYVKLGADIDYYGYQFTPIACQYNFRGNFDGQGKTISNIEFVTEYDAYGLFGYAYQATVQNVNVKGMNINPEFEEGAYLLGGIVAYNFGSDVINCSAQGSMNINVNNSDLTVFAGGVCGFMQGTSVTGAIQYCTSDVTIQSPGSNAVYSVGGIVGAEVGLSDSALAITTNCVANVNINGQINFAGGVAGFIRDRSAVVNCFTSGQIRATDPDNKLAAAGAIVGLAANESVIKNCYSYARTQDNVAISGDLKTDETKVIGKYQPANWNSLYSNAVLVENSYVLDFSGEYGDKDFNTEAGVLQNMKWNEEEWIFTDATVLTPGVKFVATLTNPIIVTLNFGNETLTVSGGTQIGEKKDTLPAYTPAGMVYPNMLHSAWTGSNGGLSTWISDNGYFPYGVFFDAALTQPVPAAYVFTEDKTVFAGFADYDAFKGEYAVQYNGQLSTVAFDSIFADIPFANSGSIIIVYVEENVIRLVKPSIVSGDGDYFVTFNEDGTITITDGINLRLTGYIPNSVTGSWFDSDNTEYKFNHDYTGTIGSGSDAVSFEYEVNGNTIIVKIGEENSDAYTLSTADGTLTNNDTNAVLRQKAYDAYRGVWE
ncbi:MAG: InlB B-repeat-containing protein, partial [Clostridia bacterium]|nr:InlB B-repeat-containing protein [Clostridia bacterium]